ncbi:MAG: DNA repair protein, partial [uncultured bacterium]
MLTHIHIQNFAIVKSLSLDFQNDLHVLTGETGAGKSIWVDAVEIALGARADHAVIYPGETICDISLCFDLKNLPLAKKWMCQNEMEESDECIIRRIIYQDKPSKTTLNGKPLPQQLIRELSGLLICVHSQHQHQSLLKSSYQRAQLDQYANHDVLLNQIESHYLKWQSLTSQLEDIKNKTQNKTSDLTLWQYQLEELQNLKITQNEYESLFQQYQKLHQAKQFIGTLFEALLFIQGEDQPGANDYIQNTLQKLRTIRTPDKNIENIILLLQTAAIHLDEASDVLKDYCQKTDGQLDNLDQIEQRLTILQDAARKHHTTPESLSDIEKSLQQK